MTDSMIRLNSRFDAGLMSLIKFKHKWHRLYYALSAKYYEFHQTFFDTPPEIFDKFIESYSEKA